MKFLLKFKCLKDETSAVAITKRLKTAFTTAIKEQQQLLNIYA